MGKRAAAPNVDSQSNCCCPDVSSAMLAQKLLRWEEESNECCNGNHANVSAWPQDYIPRLPEFGFICFRKICARVRAASAFSNILCTKGNGPKGCCRLRGWWAGRVKDSRASGAWRVEDLSNLQSPRALCILWSKEWRATAKVRDRIR